MNETNEQEMEDEIFIKDGVVLKAAPVTNENDINTNGTLSLIRCKNDKITVEWRPTDVTIESDTQDHEWALVDTIRRRTRTLSGGSEDPQLNSKIIRFALDDVAKYRIATRNSQITFDKKNNDSYSFYFLNGDVDLIVQYIKTKYQIVRDKRDKNTFNLVEANPDIQNLNKSFAELDIFQDSGANVAWYSVGNIVTNMKQRPGTTVLELLAKLAGSPESMQENVNEMLTKSFNSETSNTSIAAQNTEEYELVNKLPPRICVPRGAPLNSSQWEGLHDCDGRIEEIDGILTIIFRGGIDPVLRYEVWKYLLNYLPWRMTHVERIVHQKQKAQEYFTMKQQWKSIMPAQESRFTDFHERKSLVEKDVNRTDRNIPYFMGNNNPNLTTLFDILMTYVMYNFDLGYVQGMSDLLSPILCLLDNEVDAFWCFVGFMEKVETNFDIDQAGMKFQLSNLYQLLTFSVPELADYFTKHDSGNMYFCFRWLLVLFKREFSNSDIMRLWEILWTGLPCANFHLLISIAILDTEKDIIIERGYGFTEILKHINDLSLQIDLPYILSKAEAIYLQIRESAHLTDPIRAILGLPLVNPVKNDSENNYQPESSNNVNNIKPVEMRNGFSTRPDAEEVGYQKSIEMNFL